MYNSIAILYYREKRFDEALEYWLQAFSIAKEFDDKLKISKYVNNIGIWYWKDFDYSKAIDYYQQSLAIKEELGDIMLHVVLQAQISRENYGFDLFDSILASESISCASDLKTFSPIL